MTAPEPSSTVPLQRHQTGLLSLIALIDQHPIRLVIDSGASHTVLGRKTVTHLRLPASIGDRPLYTYHVGGAQAPVITVERFTIGAVLLGKWRFPVLDLDYLNAGHVAGGDAPIDGMLGADVLEHCRAQIDFEVPQLLLRPYDQDSDKSAT